MSEELFISGLRCQDCQAGPFTKPIMACRSCGSNNFAEEKLSSNGTLYTFTIVHAGYGELKEKAPYCLGVVELSEGPKVITIVEDIDVNTVKIGDKVKLKYLNKENLPIFSGA